MSSCSLERNQSTARLRRPEKRCSRASSSFQIRNGGELVASQNIVSSTPAGHESQGQQP